MKLHLLLLVASVFCNGAAAWSFSDMWDWISGWWGGDVSSPSDPNAQNPAELEPTSMILSATDEAAIKLEKLVSSPSVNVNLKAIQTAIDAIKSSPAMRKKYEAVSKKKWERANISVEYVLAGDIEALKGRLCSTTLKKDVKSALSCDGPFGLQWTSAKKMGEMKYVTMKFQVDKASFGTVTLETKLDGTGQLSATYDPEELEDSEASKGFDSSSIKIDFHQAIALVNLVEKRPGVKLEFNTVTLLKDTEELNSKLRDGYVFKPGQAYYQFGHRKEYRMERDDATPFQFVGSQDGCVNLDCIVKA